MSDFNSLFRAVHGEIWSAGTDASPELEGMLSALSQAPLPAGVRRLRSADWRPGPHLGAQGGVHASVVMTQLDGRRHLRSKDRKVAVI